MDNIIKRRPLSNNISLPDTLHPVIKRVLAARDINDVSELDYGLQNLLPYSLLLGIDKAVNLLYEALSKQARILIVADYDADGATSCALAIKALRQMGAKNVGFLVPNREKHGYGLTPEIVKLALTDSLLAYAPPGLVPDLLITVDNGISSIDGVEVAKQHGMRVLITDHHLPGEKLPKADAIVNPKQNGDNFPSKNLCGVGVIFYVMMALRARLRDNGWFSSQNEPNLANFLDLVALGTVADVVTLDYNNRILVAQGLRRIRADRCCPGIRALVQVCGRDQKTLVASDLGFYLGPRINAAGRMDDMSHGIACLLSENDFNAREHAQLLQTFNQERRLEEAKMQLDALEMLDTLGTIEKMGLCLLDEKWHQGLVGILAARIKDRLHRPVIIFTYDKENKIRGSGRSVQGVHIRDVIDTIATQHPEMVTYFGGHAMAAGLTIPRSQFEAFQQAFDEEIRKYLSADDLQGIIFSDGTLSGSDFNLDLAKQLKMLTPWGHNFPEPIFDGEFELVARRVLKNKHLKMQVRPLDGGPQLEVIAFNTVDTSWPPNVSRLKMAYKLDVNVFRGLTNLQLMANSVAVNYD
ncbi:ssDNA exonuclease RecJ [Candidatus Thiomargarita nelsonii]|uniref:Single-stranded-DNA-specific exonuclease RecJ n=1 Tax=Candidatus Thiomargarita nelsonii TaxID=1003181 RepID=A0A0A6P0T9_9GAMM|nr:ssDNA exonuclease RecJ [Candidatus Thiomargarita nelsonii]